MANTDYIVVKRNGQEIIGNTIEIDAYPSDDDKCIYLTVFVNGSDTNNAFGCDILGGDNLIDLKRNGNTIEIRPKINYSIYEQGEIICSECGEVIEDTSEETCPECGGSSFISTGNTYGEVMVIVYSRYNYSHQVILHLRQKNMVYDLSAEVKYYSSKIIKNVNGENVEVHLLDSFPCGGINAYPMYEYLELDVETYGGSRRCHVSQPKKIALNEMTNRWEFMDYDRTLKVNYLSKVDDEEEHKTNTTYSLKSFGKLHLAYEGEILYCMKCSHLDDYTKNKCVYFQYIESGSIEYATYKVIYRDKEGNKVFEDKNCSSAQVGIEVTEIAPTKEGYKIIEPSTITKVISKNEEENIFEFVYDILTSYTVKYLDYRDLAELAAEKVVTNVIVDSEITERAISIEGYELLGSARRTERMRKDASENIFEFLYKPNTVIEYSTYKVTYRDRDDNVVFDDKVVTNVIVGSNITENALTKEGYQVIEPSTITKIIEKDTENIFEFKYDVLTSYKVKYVDNNSQAELATEKVVTNVIVGSNITENAINIDGYKVVGDSAITKTMLKDSVQNEFIFVYEENETIPVTYYIKHVTDDTPSIELATETKTATLGDTVTAYSQTFEGYMAKDPQTQTEIIDREGVVITFTYKRLVEEKYVFEVSPILINVSWEGNSDVTVNTVTSYYQQANGEQRPVEFTSTPQNSWITEGGDNVQVFDVAKNDTTSIRDGKILFKQKESGMEIYVDIHQYVDCYFNCRFRGNAYRTTQFGDKEIIIITPSGEHRATGNDLFFTEKIKQRLGGIEIYFKANINGYCSSGAAVVKTKVNNGEEYVAVVENSSPIAGSVILNYYGDGDVDIDVEWNSTCQI